MLSNKKLSELDERLTTDEADTKTMSEILCKQSDINHKQGIINDKIGEYIDAQLELDTVWQYEIKTLKKITVALTVSLFGFGLCIFGLNRQNKILGAMIESITQSETNEG